MQKTYPMYACQFCGDITTGTLSATGKEYDCCRRCCMITDENLRLHQNPNEDTGPYTERGVFPPCPICGFESAPTIDASLECLDAFCGNEWVPEGVYLDE